MSDNGEFGMNILVFEGGGAGGLSGLFILSEIMGRVVAAGGDRRIRKTFTVVAGTGTGALYVCMLGRLRIELEQTITTFVKLVKDIFSDRKMISMSDTAAFKAVKLETALKQIVKDATGNENTHIIDTLPDAEECKTMIFAMSKHNMTASAPRIFRSYQGVANQMPNCTVWEALRATMAHPDLFKSIQIGGPSMPEELIGGDVGCSNPISHVLAEVGAMYPNQHIASIICIGAGHASTIQIPKPNPLQMLVPTNVLLAMKNMATDSERAAQEMAGRFQSTKGVYFRFNVDQGMQSVKMSEWQRQGEVVAHTRAYMMKVEVVEKTNQAIQAIKERKRAVEISSMNVKVLEPSPQQLNGIKRFPGPSPLFTGCDSQVDQVTACLLGPPEERRVCVVHGLGGVGKTQIALQAIERTKTHWCDIIYVDATSLETTVNTFTTFAAAKHIGETHQDVIRWLEYHSQPWLLVFDNADDPDLNLRSFIPQGSQGSVLVTTRLRSLALLGQGPNSECSVGGMSSEDSLELLLKMARRQGQTLPDEEVEAAKHLIQDLGFLALAIVHAGAYVWCSNNSFVKYRRECLEHPEVALERYSKMPTNVEQYEKTVYTTWLMSYGRLGPRARQILRLLGFLHHKWIVEGIFRHAATNTEFRPEVSPGKDELAAQSVVQEFLCSLRDTNGSWDSSMFLSTMGELVSYSLIDYDRVTDAYSLHVLVQSWARNVEPDFKAARLEQASYLLALSTGGFSNKATGTSRRGLSLHVGSLLNRHPQASANDIARFAQVYCDNGEWKSEERLLERVVETRKRELGDEHPDTLTSMGKLSSNYSRQGRWGESGDLELGVLDKSKRVLGGEHRDTLGSMSNLAWAYSQQGRWDEAEALGLQVLHTKKRVLGEEDPDTLESMSNLASTYLKQGRWTDAEVLEVRAVDLKKRVLGEDHPDTLDSMGNLAWIYSEQSRWDEAAVLGSQVVHSHKRVLGEEHPDTLGSMSTLAWVYLKQGKLDEAETLGLQVLDAKKRVLGEEHPDTLEIMSDLAITYLNRGQWSESKKLGLHVLEKRKRVLGEEHRDTLMSLSNLAWTYACLGHWAEAEQLELKALDSRRRVLGEGHPDTLDSMSNLVWAYLENCRWGDAERLEVQAIDLKKRALGEEHPSTLDSMSTLAWVYYKQCRLNEAEMLGSQVLTARKRVLGEAHPDTVETMDGLALTYSEQGRWNEAEVLQLKIVEARKTLGPEHVHCKLDAMRSLLRTYEHLGYKRHKDRKSLRKAIHSLEKAAR